MTRGTWLLAALVLITGAAQSQTPGTYTITLRDKLQGDVIDVDEQSTEQSKVKIDGPDGKALIDRSEARTRHFTYRETIVEKTANARRPDRLSRQYSRAEVKVGDQMQQLAYHGQTVLIEKKDGKYRFQIAGGKELTEEDARLLDEEFNKKGDGLDIRRVLLPSKPVRIGETWKIDPAPLVKELTRGDDSQVAVDLAGATATGKLLEVREDKPRTGRMEFQIELPLKEFTRATEKRKLDAGSRMVLTLNADVCIDGSANSGVIKNTMKLTASGPLDTPNGKGKLQIESRVNEEQRRQPPPGK